MCNFIVGWLRKWAILVAIAASIVLVVGLMIVIINKVIYPTFGDGGVVLVCIVLILGIISFIDHMGR